MPLNGLLSEIFFQPLLFHPRPVHRVSNLKVPPLRFVRVETLWFQSYYGGGDVWSICGSMLSTKEKRIQLNPLVINLILICFCFSPPTNRTELRLKS